MIYNQLLWRNRYESDRKTKQIVEAIVDNLKFAVECNDLYSPSIETEIQAGYELVDIGLNDAEIDVIADTTIELINLIRKMIKLFFGLKYKKI